MEKVTKHKLAKLITSAALILIMILTTATTAITANAATKHTHTWKPIYKTITEKKTIKAKVKTGKYKTKEGMRYISTEYYKTKPGVPLQNQKLKGNKVDITNWSEKHKRKYEKEHNLQEHCLDAFVYIWTKYKVAIYETVNREVVAYRKELKYYRCSVCRETKSK